jgi:hypothetical protein
MNALVSTDAVKQANCVLGNTISHLVCQLQAQRVFSSRSSAFVASPVAPTRRVVLAAVSGLQGYGCDKWALLSRLGLSAGPQHAAEHPCQTPSSSSGSSSKQRAVLRPGTVI